jgi:hypothetical protein
VILVVVNPRDFAAFVGGAMAWSLAAHVATGEEALLWQTGHGRTLRTT